MAAAAAAVPTPAAHMATHAPPRRRKPATPNNPSHPSTSPWLANLLATLPPLLPPNDPALASLRTLSPTRAAFLLIRAAHASSGPAHSAIVAAAAAPDASSTLISYLSASVPPEDHVAALVAAHTLSSEKVFRDAFVSAKGLLAICDVIAPPIKDDIMSSAEREGDRLGSVTSSRRRILPDEDGANINGTNPVVRRALWNAGIRTIAKLTVCSVAACAASIQTGALLLLAKAAKPSQPMDIRLRAAAGLAAIAAWSGPRRAMEIVEMEDVVLSMTAILTEQDERIPSDLRTATIDGLVVMSHRRHARRVLQKHNTEEKIKEAARYATVSGDYAAAARGTVAAGQLTGRSIDEYGFFVEDSPQQDDKRAPSQRDDSSVGSDAKSSAAPSNGAVAPRMHTGLRQIQQQLLEEAYTSVEDLDVLEEIVHEDAGVLSSSPRDRKYMRQAFRNYGVSADEIQFLSLEENTASSNSKDEKPQGAAKSSETAVDTGKVVAQGSDLTPPRHGLMPATGEGESGTETPDTRAGAMGSGLQDSRPVLGLANSSPVTVAPRQLSSSSARMSSNLLPVEDPDFDRSTRDMETDAKSNDSSNKSDTVSPLVMFSSATKRAAEKDGNNNHLQKTMSQLNRETQHERTWREVIEERPEMLRRERGRSSRVVSYRELALVPVPSSFRRRLWPILLDTASLRETKPGLYASLRKSTDYGPLPDDIEHTIEADVTRTMPLHSLFWSGGAQVGVQSLRSILRAYARYVPDVGYCQGMSSIAAIFIMNADDEEEAFLMMVQFMSRFQYKKVFAPGFPLMLQWISELKPLVEYYMPELNARFERENVSLELYADKWLITALSHNFPHRYLLRVWDLMFLGGSPKIVLKACLAVLKKCESRLMKMDFETMMPFLQRGFADPETGVLDAKDPEPFITLMREFRFLPDIKKGQTKNTPRKSSTNSHTPKPQRREGRTGGSCLPCFKRSQTLD